MKISVITVVFNNLEGIKRTVQSVATQKDKNFEYIIVDGNSTDGTKEYVLSIDVAQKKISEPDNGIYNAMNKAVKLAEGEFCIFMNAGDQFHDDKVILNANRELGYADLYVGHTVEVGKDITQCFTAPKSLTIEYLLNNSIYHQSSFIRTSLLKEHPYSEKYKIVSDWAFFTERWLNGAEYCPLNFYVSYYFLDGYSQQHVEDINIERTEFIHSILPMRVYDMIYSQSRFMQKESKVERKVRISMEKAPISRDLSLIRYGGKFLFKDFLSFKSDNAHSEKKSSSKTRVLYDSQAFDMQTHGGVSRCFSELYLHMPKDVDAKISVLETDNTYLNNCGFPREGSAYEKMLTFGGKRLKRFCYKLKYNFKYGYYSKWDMYPRLNQYESVKQIKNGNFDVFHPTFFSPYFLSYLHDKPFVLTVHDMITELYPQYYHANDPQLINKRILIPRANHIIAVSQSTKRDIMRFFNYPEDKISVVYHGSDTIPYIPTPNSNRYGEYILYVGERHWYKNFKLFLRDVIPVLKRHKELKVICTGKPFSTEESLLIDFLSMKERFIQVFIKTDKEFLDLYHNAIAFVYPSEYEGFGIPILEAYKADCPVMLNHASCFPEIAGDAAIYFEYKNDRSNFEEQFETLYHLNSNERESLLQTQRERLAMYSWEESSKQLAKIYKSLS